MAIKIVSTKKSVDSVKLLIFGESGVGKTKLIETAPNPLILNAERGLLSLANNDFDTIDINTLDDIEEAFQFITESQDAKKYDTIALDSVSEIAQVYLNGLKKLHKDPRAAYGILADGVSSMIRDFRDIQGKHVYFVAQAGVVEDENGITEVKSIMPGKTLTKSLPFFFDEVLALRFGYLEDKTQYRYLQTTHGGQYKCKDRSGYLDEQEKPDLGNIFDKIVKGSHQHKNPTKEVKNG